MEYRSPVCKARICRKSPLMFQHPSFILARRNNRHHFRVSSRVMPMPPGYTKVFGFAPTWCTKECLTRKCRAFFCCSILRRHDLVQRRRYSNRAAVRKCCKERHSAAFLSPRESPRWCTRKSRNECCGFFVAPFPLGRTRTSRERSCSSRGDWSLKMVAGLWAGATIERERKRGANNVRRARRTTARAVLQSKMEALQADKRIGLNS